MTTQPSPAMVYELRDGLSVAKDGPVVIDGILHRVEGFYVVCSRSLNRNSWNVTMFEAACPVCFPTAKDCRLLHWNQQELFA